MSDSPKETSPSYPEINTSIPEQPPMPSAPPASLDESTQKAKSDFMHTLNEFARQPRSGFPKIDYGKLTTELLSELKFGEKKAKKICELIDQLYRLARPPLADKAVYPHIKITELKDWQLYLLAGGELPFPKQFGINEDKTKTLLDDQKRNLLHYIVMGGNEKNRKFLDETCKSITNQHTQTPAEYSLITKDSLKLSKSDLDQIKISEMIIYGCFNADNFSRLTEKNKTDIKKYFFETVPVKVPNRDDPSYRGGYYFFKSDTQYVMSKKNDNAYRQTAVYYLLGKPSVFNKLLNSKETSTLKGSMKSSEVYIRNKNTNKLDYFDPEKHYEMVYDDKVQFKFTEAQNAEDWFLFNNLEKFNEPKKYTDTNPLHYVAYSGDLNTTKEMLEKNFSIQAKDSKDRNILFYAAVGGSTEVFNFCFEELKEKGLEELSKYKENVLQYAIWRSAFDVSHNILRKLKDIKDTNKVKKIINNADVNGDSSLHLAAQQGNIPIAEELINLGANKEARNLENQYASHCAVSHGHIDFFEKLVNQYRFYPNQSSKDKNRVLDELKSNDTKSIQKLIDLGCDPYLSFESDHKKRNTVLKENFKDVFESDLKTYISEKHNKPSFSVDSVGNACMDTKDWTSDFSRQLGSPENIINSTIELRNKILASIIKLADHEITEEKISFTSRMHGKPSAYSIQAARDFHTKMITEKCDVSKIITNLMIERNKYEDTKPTSAFRKKPPEGSKFLESVKSALATAKEKFPTLYAKLEDQHKKAQEHAADKEDENLVTPATTAAVSTTATTLSTTTLPTAPKPTVVPTPTAPTYSTSTPSFFAPPPTAPTMPKEEKIEPLGSRLKQAKEIGKLIEEGKNVYSFTTCLAQITNAEVLIKAYEKAFKKLSAQLAIDSDAEMPMTENRIRIFGALVEHLVSSDLLTKSKENLAIDIAENGFLGAEMDGQDIEPMVNKKHGKMMQLYLEIARRKQSEMVIGQAPT